jgi:hypothetical protein
MTPTTQATKNVTKSVFDLQKFDDVKLTRTVTMPAKPATVEEALAAVGNDKQALLNVIYDGLCERAVESARTQSDGWLTVDEDGEPSEPYTGQPVSEEKGKAISLAVLNIAKAAGYDKSLSKDKKRELKAQAMEFLRSNPLMIQFMASTPSGS